eukprot:2886476-Pleurochrysis_carterae.AAC.2
MGAAEREEHVRRCGLIRDGARSAHEQREPRMRTRAAACASAACCPLARRRRRGRGRDRDAAACRPAAHVHACDDGGGGGCDGHLEPRLVRHRRRHRRSLDAAAERVRRSAARNESRSVKRECWVRDLVARARDEAHLRSGARHEFAKSCFMQGKVQLE